jgi:prevent-host-death family protein
MTIMAKKKKTTFNVAEAKAQFSGLIRRALAGDEIVIAKDHRPLVKLVPLVSRQSRTPGSAKGLVRLAPDFDRLPPDFKDYA